MKSWALDHPTTLIVIMLSLDEIKRSAMSVQGCMASHRALKSNYLQKQFSSDGGKSFNLTNTSNNKHGDEKLAAFSVYQIVIKPMFLFCVYIAPSGAWMAFSLVAPSALSDPGRFQAEFVRRFGLILTRHNRPRMGGGARHRALR
ncbi:MAG: hypothetical protein M5U34_19125 [Chloroflexi bacterium]|nr:hypothetical protein [Chloroflexota bacterium]